MPKKCEVTNLRPVFGKENTSRDQFKAAKIAVFQLNTLYVTARLVRVAIPENMKWVNT